MIKRLLTALCLLSLAGCASFSHPPSDAIPSAVMQAFPLAAENLGSTQEQLAEPSTELNYHAMLATAQKYADAQQYDEATKVAQHISTESVTPLEKIQFQLLNAQIALGTDKPAIAQQILQDVADLANFPLSIQIVHDDLLARSYEALGQILAAIKIRLNLALLLNANKGEKANKQALWRLSQQLSPVTLMALSQDASQPILSGWAKLTLIAKHDPDLPPRLDNELQSWRLQYPGHPASTLLADGLPLPHSTVSVPPKKVAILLPLHGHLGLPGQAVWQGFLYAYYQMSANQRPTLLIYDLSQIDVCKAYQQATEAAVDFIVGPLSKEDVDKVASNHTKIPTLALNYSDKPARANFYEFGLSLKNDIEQIAQRICKDNRKYVLTITMDDSVANALLADFTQKFVEQGGKIMESIRINAKTNLQTAIANALQIKQSENSTDRKDLTRRQDLDAIFLNLPPEQARSAMPLLQYYYAGDLPVYATSLVYNGSPASSQNCDLNKIMFTELPWIIRVGKITETGPHTLAKLWPESYQSYPRLYAIGIDAYHLIFKLNRLQVFPESSYNGVTGSLSIDEKHRISQQLSWAKFVNGRAIPYTHK